ncbi:MAG: hypothetical protein IT380_27575 [Myxococcales bacterium]|nr:hypothetical protein [Myxococcales bacterium]
MRCLSLFACAALAGCPGPSVDCRVGADCASGVCRSDGTCAPVDAGVGGSGGGETGGGTGGGGSSGGGMGGGSGDGGTPDGGTDAGMPVGCQPNRDGVVQRSEIFLQPGLRATFLTSGAATFDTAGTAQADGGRFWDFSTALSGDASRLVETRSVQGTWFEAEYPDAGYYTELGQGTELLAVFGATPDGLYLQGVVSTTDDLFSTRVRYSPWVKVLQFPLRSGDTWSTTTSVSGRFNGVVLGIQSETYASQVDRVGDAKTPYATFGSLRVRTVMNRTINFVPTLTLRTFTWVTECFGSIATAQSQDNETSTEFTDVKEVRRLSP